LIIRIKYGSTNPEEGNGVYQKIAKNRPFLSPFTFWEFKLVFFPDLRTNASHVFSEISKMIKDELDMKVILYGSGKFSFNGNFTKKCRDKRSLKPKCSVSDIYKKTRR